MSNKRPASPTLSCALALIGALTTGCRSPATQIQLFIGTDAPDGRRMTVEIFSFAGEVAPEELQRRADRVSMGSIRLVRESDGSGTFVSGGSIGVLPPQSAADGVATLWLRLVVAASATAPELRIDRAARVTFVRGRSGTSRLFLPVTCADQSVGCSSVSPELCTVSVRCREQNATCGDLGECVGVVVPVTFVASDGAVSDVPAPEPVDVVSGRVDVVSDVPRVDVATDVPSDVPNACVAPATVRCGGVCVDTQTSIQHCGVCGNTCDTTPNGSPLCGMGACTYACDAGFQLLAGRCVSDTAVPRAIAPMSLGDTLSRRPTFRWELPAGFDGARLTLCQDRGCGTVHETVTALGTVARPVRSLPASAVVYWRLQATIGAAVHTRQSPTWLFHTPSGVSLLNSDSHPHLDVNADGYDDVAVGSPLASPPLRPLGGTVSIFHGSAMGVTATPTHVLDGAAAGDGFGSNLANAGDVNGDGYGDLIIGAPFADGMGRSNSGTATIYYGGVGGINPVPARVLQGSTVDDFLGASTAGLGDVNRDGYADVVVGAPSADPMGRNAAGTASVFFGSATGIPDVPSQVFAGVANNDQFGLQVAGGGDFNVDGFGDLVVGAPLADPAGRMDAGTVSVYLGSAMGLVVPPGNVIAGGLPFDNFGFAVAGAGDFNGDGFGDLAVGAPNADFAGRMNGGSVTLFAGGVGGLNPMPLRVIEASAAGDSFGYAFAAGDYNNDGFTDLAISAPNANPAALMNAGTVAIFHGSMMGLNNLPTILLEGTANADNFGNALASAGDLNSDGYSDLIVAAYLADIMGRMNAGAVSVYHGGLMGITTRAILLTGPTQMERFGYSIASHRPRQRRGMSTGRSLRL